jgi:hypothetical protein
MLRTACPALSGLGRFGRFDLGLRSRRSLHPRLSNDALSALADIMMDKAMEAMLRKKGLIQCPMTKE